jgi:hypothetical protein
MQPTVATRVRDWIRLTPMSRVVGGWWRGMVLFRHLGDASSFVGEDKKKRLGF